MRRRITRLSKQKSSVDKNLLILTFSLIILGLIAVADVSAPQALNMTGDKFFFLKQQLVWSVIGIVVLFVTSTNLRDCFCRATIWSDFVEYNIGYCDMPFRRG